MGIEGQSRRAHGLVVRTREGPLRDAPLTLHKQGAKRRMCPSSVGEDGCGSGGERKGSVEGGHRKGSARTAAAGHPWAGHALLLPQQLQHVQQNQLFSP